MSYSQKEYNLFEQQALSINQIHSILRKGGGVSNVTIIELNHLENVNNLDDILPNNSGAIIYIPINSANSGHYNGIIRYNNIIYWFDSYGKSIKEITMKVWNAYGTNAWGLTYKFSDLIISSGLPVYMNDFEYQTTKATDSTCGRWSTSFLVFFYENLRNKKEYDINIYHDMITKYKNDNKLPTYDDAVERLTEPFLQ